MTEIETYQRNGVTVTIGYDDDGDNSPATWGNYELVTFGLGRSLSTDCSESDYFDYDGKPTAELREWLLSGKAFGINYQEHGNVLYSLNDADSDHRPDGLIIFSDSYVDGVNFDERQRYAEGDLATYTDWANGNVYYYSVTDVNGNDIDTLYSIYGLEYAKSEANIIADSYVLPRSVTAKPAGAYHV